MSKKTEALEDELVDYFIQKHPGLDIILVFRPKKAKKYGLVSSVHDRKVKDKMLDWAKGI